MDRLTGQVWSYSQLRAQWRGAIHMYSSGRMHGQAQETILQNWAPFIARHPAGGLADC